MHQQQHVVLGAEPANRAARSGRSAARSKTVAGSPGQRPRRGRRSPRRSTGQRHVERAGRPARAGTGSPSVTGEDGAQALVPGDDVVERLPQRPGSSGPLSRSASGTLYVADGPSIWSRNHSRCCAADSGTRSGRRPRPPPGRAGLVAPRRPRSARPAATGVGCWNRSRTRQLHAQGVADAADQPGGEQRVAAEVEEVVVDTDGPGRARRRTGRRGLLGRRARRPAAVSSARCGAGSARRSSLPLTVSGSASSTTNADGTMYSGSRLGQWPRSAADVDAAAPRRRDHVGDQPLVPGPVLAHDHRRLGHRRVRGQRRLDLAGLDPEPPHLHLIVDPAQELQLPAARSTAPGPPCGTSGDPAGPNGSATNRSAVSAARPRYPRASPAPRYTAHPAPPPAPAPGTHPAHTAASPPAAARSAPPPHNPATPAPPVRRRETVVSVGPYPFTTSTPGHASSTRGTVSGGTTSPPVHTRSNPANTPGSSSAIARTKPTAITTPVTDSPATTGASPAASTAPGAATTTAPPDSNGTHTSNVDASNDTANAPAPAPHPGPHTRWSAPAPQRHGASPPRPSAPPSTPT